MAKKKIKTFLRYLLMLVTIALLSAFLFIGWLGSKIEKVAHDAIGASLAYKTISFTDEGMLFSKVSLEKKDPSGSIDYQVNFDSVLVNYTFQPFKKQIALNLDFYGLKISAAKQLEQSSNWNLAQAKILKYFSGFHSNSAFFKINLEARIGQGVMSLASVENGELIAIPPVHLIYHNWQDTELVLEDKQDPMSIEEGIEIRVEKRLEGLKKQLIFSKVGCQEVIEIAEFLAGPMFDPWKWHNGLLWGNFSIIENGENQPYIEGEGIIQEARIDHVSSGMCAYFKEMKIELSKREASSLVEAQRESTVFEKMRWNTRAELRLTEPASFFRHLDRASQWILKDLLGNIVLGDPKSAESLNWSFVGSLITYEEPDAKIELKGSMPLIFRDGQQGFISVRRNCQDRDNVLTELNITSIDTFHKEVELQIQNWGSQEFDVVQHLWPNFNFFGEGLKFRKGSLSAKVSASFDEAFSFSGLSSVYVSDVKGKNLDISLKSPQFQGTLDELSGWMNLGIVEKENGLSLSIQGSELKFDRGQVSHSTESDLTSIDRVANFTGTLSLSNDTLQKGVLFGGMDGLRAEIQFHGITSESIATLKIEGTLSKLAQFLPLKVSENLQKEFWKDECFLTVELKKSPEGLEAAGVFRLKNSGGAPFEVKFISFFERVSQNEYRNWNLEWKQLGVSSLTNKVSDLDQKRVFLIDWLDDSLGVWGVKFQHGSFSTDAIPLDSYLACYFCPTHVQSLSGQAKMVGKFDASMLFVNIHTDNLCIDSPHYTIKIDEIDEIEPDRGAAILYYSFVDQKNVIYFPVKKASFFQKKSNLLFENISAEVTVEGDEVLISNVSTISRDVFMQGNIELNFSDPIATNLLIETHKIIGKISSVRDFSSHYSSSAFWDSAFEGFFESGDKEFFFSAYIPDDPEIENTVNWKIKGKVRHALYTLGDHQAKLSGLSLAMDYQSASNILRITDLKSYLMLGNDNETKEPLQVEGNYITVWDLPESQAHFDISLKKNGKECGRVVGASKSPNGQAESPIKELEFDNKLTYFFKIHPNIQSLILEDWKKLISVYATPEYDLSHSVEDLKLISKMGFFECPSFMLSQIEEGKPSGKLASKFEMDKNSHLLFEIVGSSVVWKNKPVGPVYVKGRTLESGKIVFDQLKAGLTTATLQIEKESSGLAINYLNLNYGPGLQLNLTGKYDALSHDCALNIHSCVADLSKLKSSPEWRNYLEPWRIGGLVKLSGKIQILGEKDSANIDVSGNIRALINGLEVRGIPINNTGPIELAFSSKEGLKLEGVDLKIQRLDQSFTHAKLALKSAKYKADEAHLSIEGLDFSLSSNYLSQLAQIGIDLFPHLLTPSTASLLKDIQCEGGLAGSLQMQLSPQDTKINLKLKDGRYFLWGKACDLQNILIGFNESHICLKAQYLLNQHPFEIFLEIDRNTMSEGRLIVKDLKDFSRDAYHPLIINWEGDVKRGVIVKRVSGRLAGLELNLFHPVGQHSDAYICLNGSLKIHDALKLSKILPPEKSAAIHRLELAGGYELRGNFYLPKTSLFDLTFQGYFLGKQFNFMGCTLSELSSYVLIQPNQIYASNLTIKDKAGSLFIPQLAMHCDTTEKWMFHIPKMSVQNFRPILLRKQTASQRCKKLLIDKLTLVNLKGFLGDELSYTASGSLYFENLPKKSFLERTLLMLPAEIIGRLGLNKNVFEPAMGTILFSVRNGKIFLHKLKEVYSEGKRSRFYIPKGDKNCFVDFKGNLHINIGTEQYNLLFKLAELGQLSVRGNLEKPVFSFMRRTPPTRPAHKTLPPFPCKS